ncbi:MAG: ATP-dependent DNA helicase RecG [Kofleriaceae bacterium]|nr:ATP-dependent DNA helicase RecG [Kofleriaceae bacterium]
MIPPAVRKAAADLQRPLLLAAADRFAGLARVSGLGHALRAACDRLLAATEGHAAAAPLVAWRHTLTGFDALDRHAQAVEVARGLRLVQTLAGAPTAAVVAAVTARPGVGPGKTPSSDLGARAPIPRGAARGGGNAGGADPGRGDGNVPPVIAAPGVDGTTARARIPRGAARGGGNAGGADPGRGDGNVPPTIDPLAAPTTSVKGIGPALAAALAERGLTTVEDLLWLVPRRWLDARELVDLGEALHEASEGDRVAARAVVKSARMVRARGRSWGEVRFGASALAAPILTVRWFNVWGGIDKRFPPGAEVALSGVLKRRGLVWEMANPDVLGVETGGGDVGAAARILPRYPDVPGVPAARLRNACHAAMERAVGHVDDGVPAAVAARQGLGSLDEALRALHAPSLELTADEVAALNASTSRHHRRLAFAELFALGAVVVRRRREHRADRATPLPATPGLADELARALPFAVTGAQRRAIAELGVDLTRDQPMNRLLQGDVGAGKTAVAFAAALHAVRAGAQVAVMAPTEILAEQHHATFARWARPLGLRTTLLTASTPRGVRQSTLALLAGGQLDLVVGTHALLAEAVGFARLGLAVIDEQHRFGVAQRVRLRQKGDGSRDGGAPHLLVMTATPIPRTLALTAYGDLDVTVIDELPPGRVPPVTEVLAGAGGRAAAYRRVVERVRAGERAFVVCPLVEASTDESRQGWADATSVHARLRAELAPLRVGLVHGKLATPERDQAMGAFARGELDVLVATTVIEVGVDVPAATVMVIEDADRFGLAQLHQLRGRIGRGGGASWCLLVTRGGQSEDGKRRLEVIAGSTDGFRIAEEDLLLRGPGELLGARQAGLPRLRFGDLRTHTELLLAARAEAERVLDEDPELARPEHAALRRILERRLAAALAFGSEGG